MIKQTLFCPFIQNSINVQGIFEIIRMDCDKIDQYL